MTFDTLVFLILFSRLFWGTFRAVSEFSLGNSRGAFHPGSSQPNHTTEHQSGVTSHGEMTPHHPQAQTKEVEVRGRRDGVGGWFRGQAKEYQRFPSVKLSTNEENKILDIVQIKLFLCLYLYVSLSFFKSVLSPSLPFCS